MRPTFAALGRLSAVRPRHAAEDADRGIYTSVDELAGLEAAARDFSFLRRQPARSMLTGRHGSRIHGRGLDFDELRQYLPGDDIRTIDWRVTARAGKPYVRVYAEEKDRPALLLVDQRRNMFFGSVRAMKSVAAAEAAALCAWRLLAEGDRIGGFVFGDRRIDEVRPERSRAAVMRLAQLITGQNRELHAGLDARRRTDRLDQVLDAAANIAAHDHLVIAIGDFDGNGPQTHDLLLRLAGHNDVVAFLVYDPFLLNLPRSGNIVVGDGELQVELGLGRGVVRKRLIDFADARAKEILAWQRDLGVVVLPVSAAEEVAPQLRRLLGQAAWRQRRR